MPDTTKIMAATAGVAAATGIVLAAGKKLIDARGHTNGGADRSGPAVVLHVRATNDGGWLVESGNAEVVDSQHVTKGRAVRAARKLANRTKPSKLVIHRGDGAVQREHEYRRKA